MTGVPASWAEAERKAGGEGVDENLCHTPTRPAATDTHGVELRLLASGLFYGSIAATQCLGRVVAGEDKELSLSVELSETGIKAAARSRTLSAIDWLGGTFFRSFQQRRARETAEHEAVTEVRVNMIKEVGELALQQLRSDPELARSAVEQQFGAMLRKEENKASSLQHTIEDLRREAPTEAEAQSGPARLSEDVMNRWARYAEDASTEELQERWGRVLASEIRRPGTFSTKELRVVDELDAATARLFERLCGYRIADLIPKTLVEPLGVLEIGSLTSAGLMIEPGLGQNWLGQEVTDASGTTLWGFFRGSVGIAITTDQVPKGVSPGFVTFNEGRPGISVFALTATGAAIAGILPDNQVNAVSELAKKAEAILGGSVWKYIQQSGAKSWVVVT